MEHDLDVMGRLREKAKPFSEYGREPSKVEVISEAAVRRVNAAIEPLLAASKKEKDNSHLK